MSMVICECNYVGFCLECKLASKRNVINSVDKLILGS